MLALALLRTIKLDARDFARLASRPVATSEWRGGAAPTHQLVTGAADATEAEAAPALISRGNDRC